MTSSLYNKYRPKAFSDVVGQSVPVAMMCNALERGNIANAYMLSGTRGVGKTTSARIFAKALMCTDPLTANEGCGECPSCQAFEDSVNDDFVELDGGSSRGIDSIRAVLSTLSLSPRNSTRRVVLIDEAHLLTADATAALLKTLEEPPGGVVFLLCTTDPMKMPATIRSRCQRLSFTEISENDIDATLRRIASSEHRVLEDGVSALIAEKSGGSLREAISYLEGIFAFSPGATVPLNKAEQCLGAVPEEMAAELLGLLCSCSMTGLIGYSRRKNLPAPEVKELAVRLLASLDETLTCASTGGIVLYAGKPKMSPRMQEAVEKAGAAMSIRRLIEMRDVLERAMWKFDNTALGCHAVMTETLVAMVLDDFEKASGQAPASFGAVATQLEALSVQVDEMREQVAAVAVMEKKLAAFLKQAFTQR